MNKKWSGKLFIDTGIAMFIGKTGDTEIHSHYAIQIAISMNGKLEMSDGNGNSMFVSGIIIPSNVPHKMANSSNSTIAVVYVEPNSEIGKLVMQRNYCQRQNFYTLTVEQVNECIISLNRYIDSEPLERKAADRLLETLVGSEGIISEKDERVELAIAYIENSTDDTFLLEEIAETLGISARYLRKLFEMQIGMSMQRYRLWRRLNIALKCIINGMDFTEASHEAFFTDSAHFSRTFRAMFGSTPSNVLKISKGSV